MRIPRIFHDGELECDKEITLSTGAATHVSRVLRLKPGDPLILFNGQGGEYRATLTSLSKRDVRVTVESFEDRDVESPLEITLVQGISRGERMDYTLQKAVELGVTEIIPVVTERTVVRLNEERRRKREQHWRGVVISACEQCGRNTLPEITPIVNLENYLSNSGNGLRLLLDHRADSGTGELEPAEKVTLLVGPEGGLSQQERDRAVGYGFKTVRFGPRIMRTETAAVAAVAILQTIMGDLGQ